LWLDRRMEVGGATNKPWLSRSIELYRAHMALSARFLSGSTDCHAFI
jgi:hypothetical protein